VQEGDGVQSREGLKCRSGEAPTAIAMAGDRAGCNTGVEQRAKERVGWACYPCTPSFACRDWPCNIGHTFP
jgi:hypothetical protein